MLDHPRATLRSWTFQKEAGGRVAGRRCWRSRVQEAPGAAGRPVIVQRLGDRQMKGLRDITIRDMS